MIGFIYPESRFFWLWRSQIMIQRSEIRRDKIREVAPIFVDNLGANIGIRYPNHRVLSSVQDVTYVYGMASNMLVVC